MHPFIKNDQCPDGSVSYCVRRLRHLHIYPDLCVVLGQGKTVHLRLS